MNWRAHLRIARLDHTAKNVFVLPGVLLALAVHPALLRSPAFYGQLLLGMLALTLVVSSNYVLNELLDAPYDRFHPVKSARPAVNGLLSVPLAYVQWLALAAAGVALAWRQGGELVLVLAALWAMGCVYNIPPLRTKELPYLDVLSESLNNPLRLLAGWYMVVHGVFPPTSLLLAYWMVGAYFMALKRFAEYRQLNDAGLAAAYRRSFRHYNEQRLLVSVMFYASAGMLFFGAFTLRYKLELALSFPFVALVMAVYLLLAFEPDSGVQHPEKLHREPLLMAAVCLCAAVMIGLLWVDWPWLREFFQPTIPQL